MLKQLFEANTWVTAVSLANVLGISARTVKTYVSELNSSYHGIISSSRKGYHIDPEIGAKALKEAKILYTADGQGESRLHYEED